MSNANKSILEMDTLLFHSAFPKGKLGSCVTKDLLRYPELGYSPGVGHVVELIAKNPKLADEFTNKDNLVVVISNGTAVLGYGNVGPIAAKPVMEAKAAILHLLGGFTSFDLEFDEKNTESLIAMIIAVGNNFGGIILEDIAAPECFYIEKEVAKALPIAVMHDDQHGTAIVVTAGVKNWLQQTQRNPGQVKIVCCGAGAAAIASLELLLDIGIKKENIKLFDSKGLVTFSSAKSSPYKLQFASTGGSIAEEVSNADMLLGLSVGNSVQPEWIEKMRANPLIMALANPTPEIHPSMIKRSDAIVCTGRSDLPNQVNNVLAFPSIMRVAVDYKLQITKELKIATAECLAQYVNIFAELNNELIPSLKDDAVHRILPVMIAEKMMLKNVQDFAIKTLSHIFGIEIKPKYALSTSNRKIQYFMERLGVKILPEGLNEEFTGDGSFVFGKMGNNYILILSNLSQSDRIADMLKIMRHYYKDILCVSKVYECNIESIGAININDAGRLNFYITSSSFVECLRFSLACGDICMQFVEGNE